MPAEARAAPTVPTDSLRKRRLLSALYCSAANIFSSLFVMRHILLTYHCHSSVAFEAFPHSKGQPAEFRATPQVMCLALSGPSIRRKCHESAMSFVMKASWRVV